MIFYVLYFSAQTAEGMSDLQALQIIHESQSEDLAAEYARHKMKDEVKYIDTPLTAVDVNSLVFTLRHHDRLNILGSVTVTLDIREGVKIPNKG